MISFQWIRGFRPYPHGMPVCTKGCSRTPRVPGRNTGVSFGGSLSVGVHHLPNAAGIFNDAFQPDRLMVIYARVNFLWIHGPSFLSKPWKLVFFDLRKIIVLHIINGVFFR